MKLGYFFSKTTQTDVNSYSTLIEIEQCIEKVNGKSLQYSSYDSNLVAEHGNVFPVTQVENDLDGSIESELNKMAHICESK